LFLLNATDVSAQNYVLENLHIVKNYVVVCLYIFAMKNYYTSFPMLILRCFESEYCSILMFCFKIYDSPHCKLCIFKVNQITISSIDLLLLDLYIFLSSASGPLYKFTNARGHGGFLHLDNNNGWVCHSSHMFAQLNRTSPVNGLYVF
jgi:hypothetical protein